MCIPMRSLGFPARNLCWGHLYITVLLGQLSLTKPSSRSQVPLRQFFWGRLCQCFQNLRKEQSPLQEKSYCGIFHTHTFELRYLRNTNQANQGF